VIAAVACALAAAGLAGWLVCERGRQREAIARAAHEVRGPLQALALGVALAARDGRDAERWRAMELELARARVALDDLQWPRGSSSTGLDAVGARELLADAARAAVARGVEASVEWTGAEVLMACGRVRVAQALANLVANAIEHGGGPIALSGRLVGDTVRFEVCDQGRGLPAPVATLAQRARRGRGRRGRGLAIAADIAAAHGGRLAAAPSRHGARLVLELPVGPPQGLARRARHPNRH
jgi:signal transduction histidine kinase